MLTSGLYAIPALVGAFIVVAADRSGPAGLPAAIVAAGALLRHPHARRALRHRSARPAGTGPGA